MHLISHAAVFGLSLAIVACQPDASDPTSPLPDLSMPATGSSVERPFKGTCDSGFELFDFVFLPPPQEDVPVSARIHQEGVCQLTYLGRTTLVLDQAIDFTVEPAHITGELVLTAANGDQLRASEQSDVGPPDDDGNFIGEGAWVWTGGAGRFAGVTGLVSWTATGSVLDNTVARSISGWITY